MSAEDLRQLFTCILCWITPTKSEPRTQQTVEIALLTRAVGRYEGHVEGGC